jgi:hypothetical protein
MLSCKQVTRLISESLDRKLAWHQRLQMRLHLLLCWPCSCFQKQVRFLRRAARFRPATEKNSAPSPATGLSPERKECLKRTLSQDRP